MTEQYLQTNINNPTLPRSAEATVAAPTIALTPDDGLVVINTDLVAGKASLPLASTMPGRAITVINVGVLPLGLELGVLDPGDTLVEPAAAGLLNPMAAAGGSLTAVSDGVTTWYLTNAQA